MEGSRSAIGVDASALRGGLRCMIGAAVVCLAVVVLAGAAMADAGPLATATRVQVFRRYTGTALAAQDTFDSVIYTSNELPSSRRSTCSLAPKGFDVDHSDVAVRGSAKRP